MDFHSGSGCRHVASSDYAEQCLEAARRQICKAAKSDVETCDSMSDWLRALPLNAAAATLVAERRVEDTILHWAATYDLDLTPIGGRQKVGGSRTDTSPLLRYKCVNASLVHHDAPVSPEKGAGWHLNVALGLYDTSVSFSFFASPPVSGDDPLRKAGQAGPASPVTESEARQLNCKTRAEIHAQLSSAKYGEDPNSSAYKLRRFAASTRDREVIREHIDTSLDFDTTFAVPLRPLSARLHLQGDGDDPHAAFRHTPWPDVSLAGSLPEVCCNLIADYAAQQPASICATTSVTCSDGASGRSFHYPNPASAMKLCRDMRPCGVLHATPIYFAPLVWNIWRRVHVLYARIHEAPSPSSFSSSSSSLSGPKRRARKARAPTRTNPKRTKCAI